MNIGVLVRTDRNQAWFYSLVVGTAVFVYVTGGAIINPTNRDWLMFGDAAQHYLGWEFFRHTPLLQWPIGANYPLGMELSSSIVFTDSIPIAAYIAKLLNPILPATFQYLGIWIWLCFVLQAFFAQRFLKFFLSNKSHVYLGACFVVLSPPLIYRLVHSGYGHIALASHWLILVSFCLYLRPGRNDLRWSLLIALCWLIQAYFAPMVAAIWLASLVKRLFMDGERSSLLKSTCVVAITSFIVMWASGYFMIGSKFNPEGWNYVFRWQPLSLVDSGTDGSFGWSRILQDRAQTDGSTEAFSFLGLGVILMMALYVIRLLYNKRLFRRSSTIALGGFLACFALLSAQISPSKALTLVGLMIICSFVLLTCRDIFGNRARVVRLAPLLFAALCLGIYSMTNRIGIGQRTIFEYQLFPPLKQFTETFRTHGRSIWPLYYLLVFSTLIQISKTLPKRYLTFAFALLLCFQIVDSSHAIELARLRFTDTPKWTTPLMDPYWADLGVRYENVIVIPPLNDDPDEQWIALNDFAIRYGINTNSGNFSRFDESLFLKYTEHLVSNFMVGRLDKQSLYIILDAKLIEFIRNEPLRINKIRLLDGFITVEG